MVLFDIRPIIIFARFFRSIHIYPLKTIDFWVEIIRAIVDIVVIVVIIIL